MRISDWSSDVCSSDLDRITRQHAILDAAVRLGTKTRILIDRICAIGQWRTHRTQLDRIGVGEEPDFDVVVIANIVDAAQRRSEEHTSELQSLMRNSYAVFCLKKKNNS